MFIIYYDFVLIKVVQFEILRHERIHTWHGTSYYLVLQTGRCIAIENYSWQAGTGQPGQGDACLSRSKQCVHMRRYFVSTALLFLINILCYDAFV